MSAGGWKDRTNPDCWSSRAPPLPPRSRARAEVRRRRRDRSTRGAPKVRRVKGEYAGDRDDRNEKHRCQKNLARTFAARVTMGRLRNQNRGNETNEVQ